MSTRKSAIGDNPLDSIISLPGRQRDEAPVTGAVTTDEIKEGPAGERREDSPVAAVPSSQKNGARGTQSATAAGPKRTRLTVKVADEMVEELRDAVMFLHTRGVHTTLVGLIEAAVEAELKRIKRKYNEGQDLPPRGAEIPVGRPISA